MAQHANCALPHERVSGKPNLRVSFLSPSTTPRPLLDLLGVTDQELQEQMAKGHPYSFNMGRGNIIPYQKYHKAVKMLMERNMPEVLLHKQIKVVFLPECHLPKMPRLVDFKRYVAKKKSFTDSALKFLGIRKGTEDISNAIGDLAEGDLAKALKMFFNGRVVVLPGGVFRVPGKGKGSIEENDFIIIDMDYKLIICIESKVTLTGSTGHSAVEQTKKLQRLLEEYLLPNSPLASGALSG